MSTLLKGHWLPKNSLIIEGGVFFIFLLFLIDFHLLKLSSPTSTPTSYTLPHVHEINVKKKITMIFVIAHKAFIFPMGNILTLTSIGFQWQTIHCMIWGF
jgi:hypothetical protein